MYRKNVGPRIKKELWMNVEVKWMAIPQSKLESLVAFMSKKIKVVLAIGMFTLMLLIF